MLKKVFFLALLLVTACTPISQVKPEKQSPQSLRQLHHQQVSRIEHWKIQGRILITQGHEAWNAGIRWWEKKGRFQIKLEGPFSQGGMTLNGNRHHVILTASTGKQYAATTPEALLMKTVGMNLPVSALRYWVKGLPDKNRQIDDVEYDQQGRIIHLKQQGWDVKILRYIPFEEVTMPAKIFISHPELSLRLVISDWSVP